MAAMTLAACSSAPHREAPSAGIPDRVAKTSKPAAPHGGGYYLNDGPGDNPPADLDRIPDAVPKFEPLHRGAMRPYTVMGQSYVPMTELRPYQARGLATWYGRRYHGLKTASGELYDMYGMTAAHTILPIPSYARVTNPRNNASVIVRINDRGPFYPDRLIDLSYTAAYKLGIVATGSGIVEVEAIIPDAGIAPAPVASARLTTPSSVPAAAPEAVDAPEPAAAPTAVAMPADPEPAVPVLPVTSEAKGVFLQLGAFGSQDNADNYVARLKAQVDWLSSSLHVYTRDGLFRVHTGPYANQEEARQAANRLAQALGIKAIVVTR